MRVKEGELFRCISAKSKFYETGRYYKLVKKDGVLGFFGSDGLFDPLDKVLSKFEKVRDIENE